MCTTHKSTHSHDHKHNPSSSCCATPKISTIKAESATTDCCSGVDKPTSSDSCCGSDPGESDPLVVIPQVSEKGTLSRSWLISEMDCPSCAAKLKKPFLPFQM